LKFIEGSTTIPEGSRVEAIATRKSRYLRLFFKSKTNKRGKDIVWSLLKNKESLNKKTSLRRCKATVKKLRAGFKFAKINFFLTGFFKRLY
jgi:hypothetical protein